VSLELVDEDLVDRGGLNNDEEDDAERAER
jgi:hypothetical protein